jgi:hypothetical protein
MRLSSVAALQSDWEHLLPPQIILGQNQQNWLKYSSIQSLKKERECQLIY